MKNIIYRTAAVALLSIVIGCSDESITNDLQSTPVQSFSGKIASDWMETVRQLVKSEGKNPPQASRIFSYNGIALYESLITGMPNNRSLSGQINGYDYQQSTPDAVLDYPIVANEVLHKINKSLFGDKLKTDNATRLDSIYNSNLTARTKIAGLDQATKSINYGNVIAKIIIEYISKDNYAETRSMLYVVPSRNNAPHCWAPTSQTALMPAEPFWGQIRTAGLSSPNMSVASEIPFSTDQNSLFYKQAEEVYTISKNLTQSQKDIANWWADLPKTTATPPGHWIAIENQLTDDLNLDLEQAAEMYALVGISELDAFISCWYSKYKFNLLRPETYIKDYIPAASSWTPFLATPAFPEYPSGHSVCSGASATVLTSLFGVISFTDKTNVNLGLKPRRYNSFNEAADEAAMSRVYGGIHFKEASTNGIKQGQAIGKYIIDRINLKK